MQQGANCVFPIKGVYNPRDLASYVFPASQISRAQQIRQLQVVCALAMNVKTAFYPRVSGMRNASFIIKCKSVRPTAKLRVAEISFLSALLFEHLKSPNCVNHAS